MTDTVFLDHEARSFFHPGAAARLEAIRLMMPELGRQRHAMLKAGIRPERVVLPACFDPGPYEGDDATNRPATIMGLPVTFEGTEIAVIGDPLVEYTPGH